LLKTLFATDLGYAALNCCWVISKTSDRRCHWTSGP